MIETAKYLSGIDKSMAMNTKPIIRYNTNCKIEDDEDDFSVLRLRKLIGFRFSKMIFVFKMILNCSKLIPKLFQTPGNRRINLKMSFSMLLNCSNDIGDIQCIAATIC